jgi:hypothetical protein
MSVLLTSLPGDDSLDHQKTMGDEPVKEGYKLME